MVLALIEEHGTPLPLATDIIEGEYWSKGAMKEVEQRMDVESYYLPSFPIASASVNEFSVGIRPLIKRKGSQYQGVIDKWKIRGITI